MVNREVLMGPADLVAMVTDDHVILHVDAGKSNRVVDL